MADRIVRVLISAEVNSYLKGIDEVSKKTREGAKDSELLTRRLEAQRQMFTAVGAGMLAAGGVIAAGLVLATKRAAEFDQAMSNVQAATHESAENMSLLRDAALDAGASTVYSAKEAAGAIEELAKAGLSTQSIIGGGLTGALDLAAAGGLEVADAAGIASTTLQQFRLSGDQASHVADVLAAGAGKAMGDVSDLSMALSQSGTVAAQFGLSLEETTGSLAAFASKGLLGSDAGTSFRSMLLRLANPTGEAAAKMKELGIQAYDAQGNFVGMTGLAGQLEKGLSGLTQEQRNAALAIIFGQDAIRAANVLYTEGASGIAKWTKEVDDAGYAGETAATRLDNLNGDLEKLSGAFDTALITIGGAGQGPLRAAVQGITELVDGFNGMPEGAQTAVYWIGAVAAAGALAGGTFLIAVPKVAAYKAAIETLGTGAQTASRMMGTLARGLGAVTLAAAAFSLIDPAKQWISDISGYTDAVKQAVGGTKTLADSISGLGARGAIVDVKDLGTAFEGLAKLDTNWFARFTTDWDKTVSKGVKLQDVLGDLGKELGDLAESNLPAAQAQFRAWAESTDGSEQQLSALLNTMGPYRDVLDKTLKSQGTAIDSTSRIALAMGSAETSTKSAADAYLEQSEQVNGVRDALRELYDQMNAANSAQQTAIQANADFVQGLADIAEQATNAGTSLDETTAAGSANAAMLAGLAGDAQAAAAAQYEVDQKTMSAKDAADKYAATLADQRQKFIDSATAAGFNADEVQALADKVFALPGEKEIQLLTKTAQAQADIDTFIYKNSGREVIIKIGTSRVAQGPGGAGGITQADGGVVRYHANGGVENHVAQIAPAGAWRVWAEPETGGESYIPLALAKRARSERILALTASIFGGKYLPGGSRQPQYVQNITYPGFSGGGGSRTVVVKQDIHPTERMSESELARIVAEKTQFAVRGA